MAVAVFPGSSSACLPGHLPLRDDSTLLPWPICLGSSSASSGGGRCDRGRWECDRLRLTALAAKGGSKKGSGGKAADKAPPAWLKPASPSAPASASPPSPAAAAELKAPQLSVVETAEPDSRVRLAVTVPEAECKKAWDKALRSISKAVQIDGFRKGDRVPDYLLLRHVGEEAVKTQVLEELLTSTLPGALESVKSRALKDSEHIQSKLEDLLSAFSPTSPLSYDIIVDVEPKIKWTPERAYASLAVEVPVEDEAMGEAAVEAQIRARHKDLGSLKVSSSTAVKMGDVVVVDISAFRIKEDGSKGDPIYSATQKGFQIDTDVGIQSLLPGFVEAILGTERTETRVFDLQFPDAWQQESLQGVTGRFEVVCQEIFERQLPPLEDSLAHKFVLGAQTMAEVRERLLAERAEEQKKKKEQATMLALLDALVDVCEMEVPPSLLEEQGRQVYGAKLIELQAGGRLSKEEAAQLMSEQMVNNYLVANKPRIERQVKQALAVQDLFRLEGLKFSAEELEAETASAVAEFRRYGQEYDEKRVTEQAAELLEGAKVLEWLKSNSKITYIPKGNQVPSVA